MPWVLAVKTSPDFFGELSLREAVTTGLCQTQVFIASTQILIFGQKGLEILLVPKIKGLAFEFLSHCPSRGFPELCEEVTALNPTLKAAAGEHPVSREESAEHGELSTLASKTTSSFNMLPRDNSTRVGDSKP